MSESESLDFSMTWQHSTAAGQPVLRTMVVCDLADSTALVEKLGDRQAAALLRKHDRLTRALIDEHGGREIDKTDGYLLLFERPTQAVAFALAYHRGLRFMSEAEEVTVRARVGIHVGDVVMWENSPEDIARGAKPVEVEGLAKPVAARLASLARPRQILLSGVAAGIARRGNEEILEDCPEAQWRTHGLYRIRGIAEPTEVAQIGEPQVADFTPPRNRAVAHRILPWWRRTSTLVAAALLLTLGIGLTTWTIMRQPPKIAFAARDWVVIGDVDNQTGQSDFNNTIDTAIRVGLQQSRFVNVIAPAKMRQTLAHMQLDTDTKVTTKVGAEIAVRNNARALIALTIKNVGGDYGLSAEIIDPTSLRVVNKVVAKASDENEIVPAVDVLVNGLRADLGESLAQIKSSSIPLEQVTTSNLEALRAYSLADQANASGNYNLSIDLLNHAIKLDPEFASAYAAQVSNYLILSRNELARQAMTMALKYSSRLSPLERMKLRAKWTTLYKSKMDATASWKVIADLYPDDAGSANNTGLYYAAYFNDCTSALPYLSHAASLPQTQQPISIYTMAVCQLDTGNTKEAIANFKRAYQSGFRGQFLSLADAYVETRQYDKASEFLANIPNDSDTVVSLALRRSLVLIDQGDLINAESSLRHALDTIAPSNSPQAWPLRLDYIGVLWAEGKSDDALRLTQTDLKTLLTMPDAAREHLGIDFPTIIAMYSRWAARLGDVALAKRGVEVAGMDNNQRGYPVRAQLIAVAQAEIALREGHAEQAVIIASAADSHPIWELLEIMARAKAAAGDSDAVHAYIRLIDARPQAFGQLFENELGICTRAAQWNLALLDTARLLKHSSPTLSSRYASLFLDHWRMAPGSQPYIVEARRIVHSDTSNSKAVH